MIKVIRYWIVLESGEEVDGPYVDKRIAKSELNLLLEKYAGYYKAGDLKIVSRIEFL